VMGPGIITANVDNDAGGITTYSVCGAHFGYSMVWSFIPILVALVIIQEMCNRMGVVTGKGLADLIREEFGVKVTFYSMAVLILANLGNAMAEFAGIAAASELFGMSKYVSVPLCALGVWWLVVKGTYKSVEKIFLGACIFYISYILSGFLVKPDWASVFRESVRPVFSFDKGFLFMLIGVVGTTIAPWMQFYQQAAVVEKGIKIKDYKYSKMDVVIGGFVVNIIAFFIVVVCAATLFKQGIRIETAKDAALALKPLAGNYCYLLFAFGLFNASLFAASILPLSTAYSVCEGMGWGAGINKRFKEAPHFYLLYAGIIIISAAVILLPKIPLIPLMLVSQVANGVLLPFILIFMIMLINNKRLMGEYTNTRFYNLICWLTIIIMISLSIFMFVSTFVK
jgi:NRAMP (natural resistance-associated macrophage protein)-like metal ion transporter